MKKKIFIMIGIIAISLLTWTVVSYWQNRQTIKKSPQNISDVINTTGMPLSLPEGFSISILTDEVPGARVMAMDSFGNIWVSQTSQGTVSLIEISEGKVQRVNVVLHDLNRPHGLAIDPQNPFSMYVAEEDKVSLVHLYSDRPIEKIIDLPSGGNHFTRTLGFGPDDRLYVSIGSTCDVCNEEDERHAAIYSLNRDGSDFKKHASGLRNAVFFTWSYVDGRMWATEMGRDRLGDDLPPDEINIIREGENYGWPTCYGKNIHDTDFDKNTYIRNPCQEPFEIPSYIDIQAHSAPLGLGFVPEEGWPEEYWYDLFVAYHGSWNRSEPTGYKIVRMKLDAQGRYSGTDDFISGWLTDEGALGRPVDIMIQPGGVMYVSDDHAGVIYKISSIRDATVNSFKECADAGYPILESYPRQCRNGDQTFVEDIGNELEKTDLIRISSPRPNSVISSPLTITGEARGYWFFEASFPVKLLDGNGNEIAVHYAEAQSEWMTENFVPFHSELSFAKPQTENGVLVLEKDNPSGLSEHADELRIPIIFDQGSKINNCIVTGCSSQICSDKEVITTCEFNPEYACYQNTRCERQNNGQCGWTQTQELTSCLQNN
ncbi:MAG: PQQ-dependent sugar dehydrogenase [Candidatus Paceibacterota bacterium]